MRDYYFRVNFLLGCPMIILTGGKRSAKILAQAEAIISGRDRRVTLIERISDEEGKAHAKTT